ncbi:hypothetical protein BT69DRAFT_695298 [Atractiella rhizophila]|nr:hypothetical protein BT69DRAFT_695298 [Atractiella rhizophila]
MPLKLSSQPAGRALYLVSSTCHHQAVVSSPRVLGVNVNSWTQRARGVLNSLRNSSLRSRHPLLQKLESNHRSPFSNANDFGLRFCGSAVVGHHADVEMSPPQVKKEGRHRSQINNQQINVLSQLQRVEYSVPASISSVSQSTCSRTSELSSTSLAQNLARRLLWCSE